jgi:hypothetical protein
MGWIIVIVIIFGLAYWWNDAPERARKRAEQDGKELFETRNAQVRDWESKARPDQEGDFYWRLVTVRSSDVAKLTGGSYGKDDMELYFVRPEDSGYMHISQSTRTPDLKLTGIQYNGQYSHTTTGELSSNASNAMLGGMIAGSAGAQIGAAGKRTITTTTIDQEISSWNILEFEVVETGEQFAVEAVLDKNVYQSLYKNYLFRGEGPADKLSEIGEFTDKVAESSVTETSESISADRTAKLVSLSKAHEDGILTDEEFSRKVSELG